MLKRKLKENYEKQTPQGKFRRNLLGVGLYLLITLFGLFLFITNSQVLGISVLLMGGIGVFISSLTALINFLKIKHVTKI